jgi:putative ABC transport system permease protein
MGDFRYALRGLRKQPGFAALAALALALGIGAATTIFSIIQNVLLDPFPYLNSERVAVIQIRDLRGSRQRGVRSAFEEAEFLDYQAQVEAFEEVIAGGYEDVLYDNGQGTEQFAGGLLSANAFQFLGVPALVGRILTPDDARPGMAPVFVMSHKMWIKHFAGDPSIVGRSFLLNGVSTTLVGIMPARFTKLAADLWKPVVLDRADPEGSRRYFMLQGRLKPGVTLGQAEAQVDTVARRIAKLYPRNYPERFTVELVSWVDSVVGDFRKTLYVLAAAVALLLLIACSNVANMLLSRAATREKEIAIRASLGARRGRLVRQLLTESFLLALLGTLLGCLFAYLGLKALVGAIPEGLIPREAVIRLNLPVLGFSLVLAALTSVIFGLAPALQTARRDIVASLRDAAKGSGGGARGGRLTAVLVVAEVALSLVLLTGAGLLVRSFVKLQSVDLGLDPANVLVIRLPMPRGKYETRPAKQALFRDLLTRIEGLPGVVAATAASSLPLYGGIRSEIEIPGKAHLERWDAIFQLVSEGYFRTLGLRLVRGRLLAGPDISDGRKVIVVNRTLVEKCFPGEEPLGRHITFKLLAEFPKEKIEDPSFEIVGVVADARNQGLKDPVVPEAMAPYSVTGAFERGVMVRTAQAPLPLVSSVRREIWAVDRSIALTFTDSLENFLKQFSYAEPRFSLIVLTVFAGVGLLLVALGVYSVIAYRVSRQTHDIGIRMALGATGGDVLRMVLRRGLALVAAGIALGTVGSLILGRILADQLFAVPPHDPAALLVGVAVVVLAGVAACYFPARRATTVAPMTALRDE